ncbi:hypothetical protein ADUPG1_013096 [Aduncisulcus paluster]|uniref:Uncharacterized protein n=1 Tax=Aduncisulcus paluster TaxID=2918883 RepID=A0ABQ5K1R4_9EUKA|nr:hypothetical protein ADUPG1_013096 [Aduncisulcus paluster]
MDPENDDEHMAPTTDRQSEELQEEQRRREEKIRQSRSQIMQILHDPKAFSALVKRAVKTAIERHHAAGRKVICGDKFSNVYSLDKDGVIEYLCEDHGQKFQYPYPISKNGESLYPDQDEGEK